MWFPYLAERWGILHDQMHTVTPRQLDQIREVIEDEAKAAEKAAREAKRNARKGRRR